MSKRAGISAKWTGIQFGLLAVSFLALAVTPRAVGPVLVVPLLPATPASTTNWLVEADARLLGTGPVPGTVIAWGERSKLLAAALASGAILLRARATGCATDAA